MTDKGIAIGAWVLALAWFVFTTWLALGFTPFSFVAWALPASFLLRRTAEWWREVGDPVHTVAYGWVFWGLWALMAIVLVFAGVLAFTPAMSSHRTPVDIVLESVAVVCLLYPPLLSGWAVWRTARVTIRASTS